MSQERRTAKRYDYDQAVIILFHGQKLKAVLRSISQRGIFFEFDQELKNEEIIHLGWKDDRVGYIKGAFATTLKKSTPDLSKWFYHARFYKLDEDSKKNTIKLLNFLNQPQVLPKNLSLVSIQKVFTLDQKIFSVFQEDAPAIPQEALEILHEIPQEEMKIHLSPNNDFERSFQRLQVYYIQAYILYQFLIAQASMDADDLEYCLEYTLYLMNEIAALEQTSGFAGPTNSKKEESPEIEASKELLNRPMIILSNKTYECLSLYRDYCESKKWNEILVKNEDTDVGILQSKSLEIVSVFQNKYEISYDENSYGEAVLARTMQEKEKPVEKAIKPEEIQFHKIPSIQFKWIFIPVASVLLIFQIFSIFGGPKNRIKDYKEQLRYNIGVQKVIKQGSNLLVYFEPAEWLTLGVNDVDKVKSRSLEFLQEHKTVQAIFVFSTKDKAEFIVSQQEGIGR